MNSKYEITVGIATPNPGGIAKMVKEKMTIDFLNPRESFCDFLGCEKITGFRIDYPILPGGRSNGNVGLFVFGREHCISEDFENDYNPYFTEDELTYTWYPDMMLDKSERRHPQRVFGPIVFARCESESILDFTFVDLYENERDEMFINLFLGDGFSIPDRVSWYRRKERLEREAAEAKARKEKYVW